MPTIKLGICAVDKKCKSYPMNNILNRLITYQEFEVIVFGNDVLYVRHALILLWEKQKKNSSKWNFSFFQNLPPEEWPMCHVLLCFNRSQDILEKVMKFLSNHRNGYKMFTILLMSVLFFFFQCLKYHEIFKPALINEIKPQMELLDRSNQRKTNPCLIKLLITIIISQVGYMIFWIKMKSPHPGI